MNMRTKFEEWVASTVFSLERLPAPSDDDYKSTTVAMAWHCFQFGWRWGQQDNATELEASRSYAENLTALLRETLGYLRDDQYDSHKRMRRKILAALAAQPMGPRLMGGSSAEESTRVDLSSSSAPPHTTPEICNSRSTTTTKGSEQ